MSAARLLLLLSLAGSAAHAATHALAPGEDVIGEPRTAEVLPGDTLVQLARRHGLGYLEVVQANPGLDKWLPTAGARVRLPTQHVLPHAPREGIVVNLAEMRLYYFPPQRPEVVMTFPVGIGREDWPSPRSVTRVAEKVEGPVWRPPESIRREHAERGEPLPPEVPPGPENPLGAYALRLALPGYLIHGTNRRFGIGMRVTHGCIRLYPQHIEALFDAVAVGTPVRLVHQAFKAGWRDGTLYVEAHPPASDAEGAGELSELGPRLQERADGKAGARVDWREIERIAAQASGLPEPVNVPLLSAQAGGRGDAAARP